MQRPNPKRKTNKAKMHKAKPNAKKHLGSKGPTPVSAVMRKYKFQRTIYDAGFASQIPTVGAGYARSFQLDELPGYTDFSTLYDQYRFTRIDYRMIPRCNTNTLAVAAVTTTALMPNIAVWFDPDDASPPLAAGEALEVENAQYHPGWSVINGSFKPHAAIAAYGGAFTQFADYTGWADCTSDDIEWYGFKCWVSQGGISQTTFQHWDVYFTVHCEFRKVR